MTYEFQLTPDELCEAYLGQLGETSAPKTLFGFGIGAAGALAATLTPEILPAIAGMVVFLVSLPWLNRRNVKLAVKRDAQRLCVPMGFCVTESSFRISYPGGEEEFRWRGVRRWLDTVHTLLLFPQTNIFYVVPKRVFTSEQWEALQSTLLAQVGPRGKLKPR